MRNPIRLKNFNLRFLPLYVLGLAILVSYPSTPMRLCVSLPFFALGLGLRGWGAGHLVKNDELTLSGPYRYLRHPLYAGTILIATGLCLLVGGGLGALLLLATWPWFALHYFPRKERVESARLEARYGPRFRAYRESVPALWPRLRAWHSPDSVGAKAAGAQSWCLERYSENNELGTFLAVCLGVAVIGIRMTWG